MEDINFHNLMAGDILPGFIFENLYIADTIDAENAYVLLVDIEADHQTVFRLDVVGFYMTVADGTAVV